MVEGYRRQRNEYVSKVRPIIDEIKSTGVRTLTEIARILQRNHSGVSPHLRSINPFKRRIFDKSPVQVQDIGDNFGSRHG